MTWYFLNSTGQEEQFKLYFLKDFLKNFVLPPIIRAPIIRDIRVQTKMSYFRPCIEKKLHRNTGINYLKVSIFVELILLN